MTRGRGPCVFLFVLAALFRGELQARSALSGPAAEWAAVQDELRHIDPGPRRYDGPPLTLKQALDEALAANLEPDALRSEVGAIQFSRAEEGSLEPPMAEAEAWQWSLNMLKPP